MVFLMVSSIFSGKYKKYRNYLGILKSYELAFPDCPDFIVGQAISWLAATKIDTKYQD